VTALDTSRLMVRPQADQVSYYKGIAWSDRVPRLVQTRMIETFQNSGAVKSVSATIGQYALVTDLRAFQIDVSSGKAFAEIEIFAKLVNTSTGKVVATKGFSARVPATTDSPTDAIAAMNQAFTEVLQDTTTWVASRRA
jgi:cholesterol transport system auxiliary component